MSTRSPKKTSGPSSLQSRKVFDVRRPGMATIPSTSRPVIVGHQPVVRDSTVMARLRRNLPLPDKQQLNVLPPGGDEPLPPEKSTSEYAHKTPEQTLMEEAPQARLAQPERKPSGGMSLKEQIPGLKTPADSTVQIEGLSDMTRKESIDEQPFMVDPKSVVTYTGHQKTSTWKILVWVLGVFVALILVGDYLLDAGIIQLNAIPHTHFIQR
ncbi:MAG TPA: hypothetical protein VGS08_02635 [Candidatus Saccharimonadales bacterium]|nr:hypothetical protein [Candidatus Saccharimonadales bacterium]